MKKYQPIDLGPLKTYSLHDRSSKVTVDDFAGIPAAGASVKDLLAMLPNQLLGRDFPELIKRRTGVKASLANQALFCVAKGTGEALEHLDTYKQTILAKR